MNKLDKYIIVNYVKSFFLGMMMFFLIFLLAESINLTGWIMDGKFTVKESMKYLTYGIPEIVTNTAPLGVLLGSLLCISKIYTATSGKINPKTNEWTFENLKEHDGVTNSTQPADTNNFKFKLPIDDILAEAVAAKNLTMPELREKIVYFTRVGADSTAMRIDFYYRISFALSSFIMCFIGLSLGSRYVRGGAAVNIGLSVIIGYSYYGLSTILKSLASSGTMPIYLACFLPLLIYLIVGIRLFMNAEY